LFADAKLQAELHNTKRYRRTDRRTTSWCQYDVFSAWQIALHLRYKTHLLLWWAYHCINLTISYTDIIIGVKVKVKVVYTVQVY